MDSGSSSFFASPSVVMDSQAVLCLSLPLWHSNTHQM